MQYRERTWASWGIKRTTESSAEPNYSIRIPLIGPNVSFHIPIETEVDAENSQEPEGKRSVCLQISEANHGLTYLRAHKSDCNQAGEAADSAYDNHGPVKSN
jgi:hypothetical protein